VVACGNQANRVVLGCLQTITRAFSNAFVGIAPSGTVTFILARLAGMRAAVTMHPGLGPTKRLDFANQAGETYLKYL
jgi:hypothetical protein